MTSLSDTLKVRRWSSTDPRRKENIKKALLHRQKEIASDSSKTCNILFYLKAQAIKITLGGLEIFNQYLHEPLLGYAYFINDVLDNLNTYAIATLKRNTGIKDVELFLLNS